MKIIIKTFLLQKNKISKIIVFIFSFSLFLVLWNSLEIFRLAVDNFYDGNKNRVEGLPFFFGERQNKEVVICAMKLIPEASKVYYWTIPELRNEISHECRAYEIAYYLFPVRVAYKNFNDIIGSDFIICEEVFKEQCSRELRKIELSDSSQFFHLVFENNAIAIFAKKGKSLFHPKSTESNETFKKRMSLVQVSAINVLCGVVGIVILFLTGYLFLLLPFCFDIRRYFVGVNCMPLSFTVGAALIGITFFYFSFCLPIFKSFYVWFIPLIILISLFILNRYFRKGDIEKNSLWGREFQLDVGREGKSVKVAKIATIIVLFCVSFVVLSLTFSIGAYDAPGQGVWGFKARQLLYYSGVEADFLRDDFSQYSHPDYPPLWAVLLAWISVFSSGSYNEIAGKILSSSILFMLLWSVFIIFSSFRKNSLISLLFTVMFAGNFYFMHVSSSYYAEPLLCLFIIWGLFFLVKYLEKRKIIYFYCAFLLLGMSALVKNEGVAIFTISAFLFFIFRGKEFFFIFIIMILTFGVWFIFKEFTGIKAYDFNFSLLRVLSEDFRLNCFLSLKSLLNSFFLSPLDTCFFWYLFFLLLWTVRFLPKEKLFILLLFCLYVFTITVIFGFSVRRIDWHLRVMPRLLILAQIIASISILVLRRDELE